MDRNLNEARQGISWKSVATAATAIFVVVFLLSSLVLDWVAAGALGVFMAIFSGVVAMGSGAEPDKHCNGRRQEEERRIWRGRIS